jgi:hypothetical protein
MQHIVVFYFHFDIFIFEKKVATEKMQSDGQFARCPAAMECLGGHQKQKYFMSILMANRYISNYVKYINTIYTYMW